MESGTVLENIIGPNRDETVDVRLIKAELSSPEDIQTLQILTIGDRALPPDTKVFVLSIGESWKIALPLNDGVTPTALDGEWYIYSQNPTTKAVMASVKCKADGTLELNGNTDTAVGFALLKVAFDLLKTEVDANLTSILTAVNVMAAAFNVAPAGTPMVSLGPGGVVPYVKTPFTATVDPAEKATVKLP